MSLHTIRHASFAYRVEAPDPVRPGEKILIEKKAWQGETVEIPMEEDVQRGIIHGAFVTSTSPAVRPEVPAAAAIDAETAGVEPEGDTEVEESSVSDMSDEELVEWIQRDKPNVRTVVDAAEGDPVQARRLLDAEDKATGGDSRKGVIDGLTASLTQA